VKKKSLKSIYVKYAIAMCVVVGLISFITVLSNISFNATWDQLARLLAFVLLASVFVGLIFGFMTSFIVASTLKHLNRTLHDVVGGSYQKEEAQQLYQEFNEIGDAIIKLSKKAQEQSLLIQEKTNEYALEKEHLFEEAIAVERGRLARELHDSVSQQLFAISMMSSAICAGMQEDMPLKPQVEKLEYMSVQAQGEMRALLMHLRPVQLEGKKLSAGINDLLTELSNKQNLDVRWQLDDLAFELGVEDHLFRILQEAISNTLRHAKATKLEVSLKETETNAVMRIFDNGVGFNKDDRGVGSYGLETMKERALEIGGTLKIMSLKDTGTQIEIKIPMAS